jgi:peptidoglycan/LPS O-acetylase OafA/YrhL
MLRTLPPNAVRSWSRIDGVDCLRGLAIFYVLMNHVNMRLIFTGLHYLAGVPRQLAYSLVWQGQLGVQIFFAISGFLITSTSIKRWGSLSSLSIRDFYAIRFARIMPLLLTLLAVLSFLHLLHWNHFVVPQKVGGLKAALVAAFTLRIGLLEATKGYLPGNWDILWSLCVEEAFYLVFPLACRLLGHGFGCRKGSVQGIVALLVLFVILGPFGRTVFTHGNETWQEYSYLGGMDAIALGCLTALLLSRRSLTRSALVACTGIGSALLIFCLCFSLRVERLGLNRIGLGMTILAIGACMLIAAAAETKWHAPRVFTPLLTYGRRSYEIYLTHMFLVFACFDFFMAKTKRSLHLVPILFLIVTVLSGILGELVGRFYSEPANRWLRTRFGKSAQKLGSVLPTEKAETA